MSLNFPSLRLERSVLGLAWGLALVPDGQRVIVLTVDSIDLKCLPG